MGTRSACTVLWLCLCGLVASAEAQQPLTVQAAVETTRILRDPNSVAPHNPYGAASISPDGKRYVLRLVRGDVARNGAWMDIITGQLGSLDGAIAHRTVARLFTSGLGAGIGSFGSDQDVADWSVIRWLDDDHVAFLWSDEHNVRQVMRLNLNSGTLESLTRHPTSVAGFDIGPDDQVVYYARAPMPAPWVDELKKGFVVPEGADALGLFRRHPQASGYDVAWNTQWFVRRAPSAPAQPLNVAGRETELYCSHAVAISPDGRYAVVGAAPAGIETGWDKYPRSERVRISQWRRTPRASEARVMQQLFVLTIADGSTRPLWSALSSGGEMKWSPDSRSLLLAPTFLPPMGSDARGLNGDAAAIVDVATGRYHQLPMDLKGRHVERLRWLSNDRVEITERTGPRNMLLRFHRSGDTWRAEPRDAAAGIASTPAVRIEVRQDLNTPPRIFAVDIATGESRLLLDPNPRLLQDYALGRVERLEGRLESGEPWMALLFYPVNYTPGRRYPLVIQSVYGPFAGSEFTLYGEGTLGPTLIAPYPGQTLTGRDIAVLHLNVHVGDQPEGPVRQKAFEALAEQLVASGLADRNKIGLLGFSRNGWYVQYTLTHSDFPFAAAIAADNWDPSYVATTMLDNVGSAIVAFGAPPFGEGLKVWLAEAAGFNVDKIRTPLRKVRQSEGLFGVLIDWEIFSRLRYLKKPVEYYVMPDAEAHGAHNTQNPGQIIPVQQGSIDWFDFWLNGREDPAEEKREQYARWRVLREQQNDVLKQSPASRLDRKAPVELEQPVAIGQ